MNAIFHHFMETPQIGIGLTIALEGTLLRPPLKIVQVVHFQVHHVIRQLIFHVAVVFRATAHKTAGKGIFGKTTNNLVYPTGHAATHIGESAFQ